jgi:serine/threonine protein kinase
MSLHDDELEVVRQQFLQEMEILSYLRHPNLLLFIGVSYDPSTRTPLWIITELMKNSLYGILHDLRLDLTLSEVVDIAVGVASGLEVGVLVSSVAVCCHATSFVPGFAVLARA